MFTNGISEKVIADTSGHRSTTSLRCYEHTSEQQQRAVTAVINNYFAPKTTSDEKKPQFPMEASENRPPMPEVCALPQTSEKKQALQTFSGSFQNCTFNISH